MDENDVTEQYETVIPNPNFIYLGDKQIAYDLTTGLEYAYIEHDEDDETPALYIYRVGSTDFRRIGAMYKGDDAREFWRQLKLLLTHEHPPTRFFVG